MNQQDRVKLLYGPYQMPKCKIGGWLRCRIRGLVRVAGITDAPTQWPYTRQPGGAGRPILILCGDLVRAVEQESETAILHWWRVSTFTVGKWRKALGVERNNEGTQDLFSRWAHETLKGEETTHKRLQSLKSPERAAKIGDAKRGRQISEETRASISRAKKGQKHSAEARRKMGEAQRRRVRPPRGASFEPEITAMLGTMPDREVAERMGLTEVAVVSRRRVLKIAAFVKRKLPRKPPRWTPERDALLGTMSDVDLARKFRCTATSVFNRRRKLGVTAYQPKS